jgi:hypothetical protein
MFCTYAKALILNIVTYLITKVSITRSSFERCTIIQKSRCAWGGKYCFTGDASYVPSPYTLSKYVIPARDVLRLSVLKLCKRLSDLSA